MKLAQWLGSAWAIDLRLDGRPGFRGNAAPPVPIDLWTTRRGARAALRQYKADGGEWAYKHYWHRARVVPVRILIVEAPRG